MDALQASFARHLEDILHLRLCGCLLRTDDAGSM